ncbi:hypothetical protein [Pontibacter oryzae]|uniref:Uncharacterized protein n=1 Tax=Pontibacter oryzae TaxID=2304593 RepID=A0A399RX77_9BACT|nr:hypothetical protein [Pontibacter oryzae]RIJ34422.1 hypothetical protein D1627_16025 [Pontibacter oryzae]
MKTFIKSFLLLLFASAFLVACENCGSTNISEPTPEDAEWLVYGTGDTATFTDNTNDTVYYVRTGIYAQSLPGEGFSVEDECIEQINTQVTNVIEDAAGAQPILGTLILNKPDSLIVKIGVGQETWQLDPNGITETKVLGDSTYTDVYVVEGSSTEPENVRTLFFNRRYGFLFIEFQNGNKLNLIRLQ